MLAVAGMGTGPSEGLHPLPRRSGSLVRRPGFVAARRGPHLAGRPPGPPAGTATARGRWQPPFALAVCLDAVAVVLLDGLSDRRAGRMVGSSKTEVGDSMELLLGGLAGLGSCQPDGRFITTLADLGERRGEMARTGEAVVVDGLATRGQRPCGWANQKVWYDAKRHAHTAQGLAVSTVHGDRLWCDGGWPGSCHEHELVTLSGLEEVLDASGVASLLDRGFRGMARRRGHWHAPVGDRRTRTGSLTGSGPTTAATPGCARWWSSRSGIWPMAGRCAAGGAGSIGFGICTALPGRWSASAGGCTESPPEAASRTPSMRVSSR
jgi:DDE superfamily endonuclease